MVVSENSVECQKCGTAIIPGMDCQICTAPRGVQTLEGLLTSIPYDWWVYDLGQSYAHMLWMCQLCGRVSGKIETVFTEEHDTPTEAVLAAVKLLRVRFGEAV